MVKVFPGDRWLWLMLDGQGSRPDFRCSQGVKHENLLGQDLDRGCGWKYWRLCSVPPLWGLGTRLCVPPLSPSWAAQGKTRGSDIFLIKYLYLGAKFLIKRPCFRDSTVNISADQWLQIIHRLDKTGRRGSCQMPHPGGRASHRSPCQSPSLAGRGIVGIRLTSA